MTTSNGEAKRWFYVREGRRQGPVETAKLVDLVLGGEVPEDALVWHAGLPEWLRAQDVEDIRRELPPPVPTRRVPPPPDPVPREAAGADVLPPGGAAASEGSPAEADAAESEGSINGSKRKRKRKHRHRDSKRRPPWFWPLVVVLIGLMVFLWWLLRRMNEVPPGRIIQTGSVEVGSRAGGAGLPFAPAASASRWGESRASAPGSRPVLPA